MGRCGESKLLFVGRQASSPADIFQPKQKSRAECWSSGALAQGNVQFTKLLCIQTAGILRRQWINILKTYLLFHLQRGDYKGGGAKAVSHFEAQACPSGLVRWSATGFVLSFGMSVFPSLSLAHFSTPFSFCVMRVSQQKASRGTR